METVEAGLRAEADQALAVKKRCTTFDRVKESIGRVPLKEHWGSVDPALNPDLDNIATSDAHGYVVVVVIDEVVVGTATFVPASDQETGKVVRMSVATNHRRTGIGRLLLDELCRHARLLGVRRLTLETTASWKDVVAFYTSYGFVHTHTADSPSGPEAHYSLDLATRS